MDDSRRVEVFVDVNIFKMKTESNTVHDTTCVASPGMYIIYQFRNVVLCRDRNRRTEQDAKSE